MENREKKKIVIALCLVIVSLVLGMLSIILIANRPASATTNQDTQAGQESQKTETVGTTAGSQDQQAGDKVAEKNVSASQKKNAEENVQTSSEQENQVAQGADAVQMENDAIQTLSPGTVLDTTQIDANQLDSFFKSYEISEEILSRINGKSYYDNPDIGIEELRYLKVLHYNFNHQVQVGELMVNASLAEDYLTIFMELFDHEYEIQSMFLIDNYWAGDGTSSDTASIQENNTSAFCYRLITGGSKISNHALGKAIDINPQQNPYISYANGEVYWYHDNASEFVDRSVGLAHMIDHNDICYQIFAAHGFTWGGDWEEPKDYQHFEHE